MVAALSPRTSEAPETSAHRDRDHQQDGRFKVGNKARAGRKTKAAEPPIEIPPAPEEVAKAGLSLIWDGLFRKAATGDVASANLILKLRRATEVDLTGDDPFGDPFDDESFESRLRFLSEAGR